MADNIYTGKDQSEKEMHRIQKLMTGSQLTEKERKRYLERLNALNKYIKGLTGAQFTNKEYERLKKLKNF